MITFYLVCKNAPHCENGEEVSIPIEVNIDYQSGLKLLRGLEAKTREIIDIGKLSWIEEDRILNKVDKWNG